MIGIFGVNGFIGRHLLAKFAGKGRPVRAVSRHIPAELREAYPSGVDFVEANIKTQLAAGAALDGVSTVIQAVSTSSPGLQNRYRVSDIQENVIPHVEFIQNAIDLGVKRYVFLSSGGAVYGPGQQIPIREDSPTNPISSHGLTKLMIEKYLQMHGIVDDLDYVILRLSNPYGPGQMYRKGQGLIPAVMSRHQRGEAIQIIGDGATRRDYIFIDDVVEAIAAAVDRTEAKKKIINVGSGIPRSVIEVIDAMEGVLGVEFRKEYVQSRKTDVDLNALDTALARSVLNWSPKVDFAEGLKATLLPYEKDLT